MNTVYGRYACWIRPFPLHAALINEAKDLLLGRMMNSYLIMVAELVSEVMQQPVSEAEVMCYEEWLRSRFYNMEQCSIWPC